ncbi:U3 small nucleolar RNA-associated protein [Thraustotheca clavata]|uniref:U3 small nucleolar RNA-associated protein n=1 Tax=Thraustotheca clavata TaxID=74557 RepID=A0A1V9ZWG5_9STRA|nr:U3 small nucleolar RNA-associated protein [Thraustotheca clavata]
MNAPKRSTVSKSWAPVRTHAGIYTGGKVQLHGDVLGCMLQEDVAIVDAATGELKFTLQGDIADEQKEAIVTFAWRPKKNQLVTASRNSLLRLWDLDTKTCMRTIKTSDSPILCMDFDPTGTLLVTGGSDRSVKVFDIEKGFATHNFRKHTGIVTLVKFHFDAKKLLVASSSDDSTVRVWDLYAQKEVACIKDHMNPATTIAFANDGYTMLTSGRDKVINFWDLRKQKLLKTILAHEPLTGIVIVPDVDDVMHFVSAGDKGQLKLWKNTENSAVVVATQEKEDASIHYTDLIYNAARNELMGITSEHNFLLFDEKLQRTRQIIGFNDDILSLKFVPTPNGGLSDNIVAATNSEQIRVMSRSTLSCELLSGHSDIVMALAVSPDGRWLISASKDGTARVWDLTTFQCVAVGAGHAESLGSVAIAQKMHNYTTNNAFFVTGSSDKTMKLWNLNFLNKELDECRTLTAMSAAKAHDKDVNALAVAPNDRFIASGSQDKLIKIWNASNLSLIGTCRGHKRGIWSLEFSPVDQCLASASSDKTIKLWSLKDYSCLKTFEGHTASVLNVQFVCAGMQLLSAGADGLVKLWTIKTNECENTLDHHMDKIWALAVAKDSSEMITGGADSTIHIWKDFTEEEEEKRKSEADAKLLKEQELMNCLRSNDYHKAVSIAFEIQHPFRLMQILRDIKEGTKGKDISESDMQVFDPVVADLDDEKLKQLLEWIRDWNTNAKHSTITQLLLSSILRVVPPSRFEKIEHVSKLLEGLIAYTERHFQRMERMLQKSYLVDFTIVSMQKLLPAIEQEDNKKRKLSIELSSTAKKTKA